MMAGPNRRYDADGGEISEKVVDIRRVAKVVKGGRHLSFSAMVVVGDRHGKVGIGLGKGPAVPDAVRKGTAIAKKSMMSVPVKGSTIPHQVIARVSASQVLMKPAAPGAGIIAGGAVRAMMEMAGIRDVVAKAQGSRNPINVVKATMEGFRMLRGPVVEAPPAAEERPKEPEVAPEAPPAAPAEAVADEAIGGEAARESGAFESDDEDEEEDE